MSNERVYDRGLRQSYSAAPPVLIAGDSDAALDRAARTVEAAGARIGAILPLDGAADRIALQASATAIWIKLDRDGGRAMDRLLRQVREDVLDGRYAAVVSASNELVDLLFCSIGGSPVELVIDGDDTERGAALAIATSGIHDVRLLSDVAADRSSERLRQVSDEVSRIASTLARLSTGPEAPARPAPAVPAAEIPQISGDGA